MASTEVVSIRPQPQDADRIFQLGTGFIFTAALQPIVRIGIPDLLANGPVPVAELAAQAGVKADPLYRVLRLLASVGVVQELSGKTFAATGISELLRSDVPGSMRDMVLWMGNPFHFLQSTTLMRMEVDGMAYRPEPCGVVSNLIQS